MANPYFQFKQFTIYHDKCAMKVTTDACLFGAWCAQQLQSIHPKNLMDIGTGTGLLSLMIAQKNSVQIDAIEIDNTAAEQARENTRSSPWKDQINIITGDIRSFAPGKKYDCIISNPPFYQDELTSLSHQKNIAHHGTHLQLGELVSILKTHLQTGGCFFLLLPYKRSKQAEDILAHSELFIHKKTFVKQSLMHSNFRVLLMGSNKKTNVQLADTISIKNKEDKYTNEFTTLLKEYYLYL
ncbi:MAG TPA: methyltransferase [Flavisolibacter sp.]|nr:methyltransferase [Flavisolibacter sp.]